MLNPTVKKIKKELRRGHKSIKLQRENRDFTTNSNEIHWIIREILKTCILINWKIWKKINKFFEMDLSYQSRKRGCRTHKMIYNSNKIKEVIKNLPIRNTETTHGVTALFYSVFQ
jgi:hypothetical protein